MKDPRALLAVLLAGMLMTAASVADNPTALREDAAPDSDEAPLNGENLYEEDPQAALDRQFNLSEHELTGIIVDRTMTMAGKTFYRAFSQLSIQEPVIQSTTLTIQERPDARWGSQLWVMEGNDVYFRTQLSPRINEADRSAEAAIGVVKERIIQNRLNSALGSNADLGKEEL